LNAIVIATKTSKCLPVLLASIEHYVPENVEIYIAGSNLLCKNHKTHNLPNDYTNFGDSYNYAVSVAFKQHDHIIVANDDIVLNPTSYSKLQEDVEHLRDYPVGWVSARSDYARGAQNIRIGTDRDGIRFVEEDTIQLSDVISPLFAAISKEAWIDFPSINWYSDDVQCLKMRYNGFANFVSRSYVHHVGSSTIGMDHTKNHQEAMEWLKTNEPDFYELFNGK
jgi:hypothetical protein